MVCLISLLYCETTVYTEACILQTLFCTKPLEFQNNKLYNDANLAEFHCLSPFSGEETDVILKTNPAQKCPKFPLKFTSPKWKSHINFSIRSFSLKPQYWKAARTCPRQYILQPTSNKILIETFLFFKSFLMNFRPANLKPQSVCIANPPVTKSRTQSPIMCGALGWKFRRTDWHCAKILNFFLSFHMVLINTQG